MIKINKLLTLLLFFTSTVLCASGEFTGWGDTILHHVADSKTININNLSFLNEKLNAHNPS